MAIRTIWTIGYEQATVPAVMNALRDATIEVLADVRALPLSRRPGFSKTALAANAHAYGIDYAHFRALGTPADGRAAARRNDHAVLERIYEGQLQLPEAMAAAAQLAELASTRRVALLCYEREPHGCHRALLCRAMLPDFSVVDLRPLD